VERAVEVGVPEKMMILEKYDDFVMILMMCRDVS
jgi:hypothetical protein